MAEGWSIEADVVVVGSGSAGMSAALSAHRAGAETVVLERSDKLGGTSAVSGGLPWIPLNHHMHEVGASDSREEALTYLRGLSLGKMDEALCETYVDSAADVIRFLEAETELRFIALPVPDYRPEFAGGKIGRALTADLFEASGLGDLRPALRMSPHFPIPISLAEVADNHPGALDPMVLADRMQRDIVGTGVALMAGLIKAAHDSGIAMYRGVRARRLVIDDGIVVGLEAERDSGTVRIRARRGVILASGGFEWAKDLVRNFIHGPELAPLSPPYNEGDALRMAMDAGADLANLSEAWYHASMRIPNEEYEGRTLNRLTSAERHNPGSILVNRAGRRFANEAQNYHDLCHSMRELDTHDFSYRNLPAWMIFHHGFLERYPILTRYPGDPIPRWLVQAPTLREVAGKIGVDADGLEATVARFNAYAAQGLDPDFHRGESAYDRYYGDRSQPGALSNLGPLDQAPFYALEMRVGAIGTRGGPRVNSQAQVLASRGGIIPGLYAAGNAMASFTGLAYPGAGSTIGPALTFGHIAGKTAALSANRS